MNVRELPDSMLDQVNGGTDWKIAYKFMANNTDRMTPEMKERFDAIAAGKDYTALARWVMSEMFDNDFLMEAYRVAQ